MSGFPSGTFLDANASNVSLGSNSGVWRSVQRSGIVNGSTQVIESAGDASAVATAWTSTVLIPKYCAISVAIGLPCAASRNTVTLTWLFSPAGPGRNSTFGGATATTPPMTLLARAAASALVTAGPVGVRSSQSL